jgi:hypothetical protein
VGFLSNGVKSRLSKEAMDQINSEILRQFENQGLSINEGIAVDARLVKSASRPISNDLNVARNLQRSSVRRSIQGS